MDNYIQIIPSDYTILIVDDVISNILLLKVLLGREKYNILTAESGEEAIRIAKNESVDLMLLDVMMPNMNGFEVAKILKQDEKTEQIPIIFLTALNSVTDIVNGFKIGANDYISKPFNKDELLIRVYHQISLISAKRIIIHQNEELQRTIKGRDKLYSVIAHDLRSPLGSIKMVLNMLVMNMPETLIGEDHFEMLKSANESTEDVFSLLDNLLKWTKSQVGKLNVVFQNFSITESVQGVINIFNFVAGVKNIQLNFDVKEEIFVRADIDMVKTVIRNLLSNAIKFSFKDSNIDINIEVVDGMAVVSVKDYGLGMSEEDQKKLFKTDVNFTKYGTNNEEGSGLGLLLCNDFVLKNNGRLWLESQKEVGTTFFFSLPLSK